MFAVVTVAAVIVFFFAARAYSRHQKQFRKQEAEIKHLLALKEKYKTLTKDVMGSAQFNTAFANYHFLRVILDYVNLILRLIGGAGIN